jgi:RNA polymerase sigma factor (sigma-70 family)
MHHHVTREFARTQQADRVAAARRRRPPAAPEDLERLVAGAAAGDEIAWDALVTRFRPALVRMARAHGLSAHEAEDAVQDTWIRFLRHACRMRDPRAVGGWLATTVRHESLRTRERARREQPTAEDPQAELADATAAEAQDTIDAAARQAAIRRALDALPPRHRTLMRALFAPDAPSYQEIAAALEIPVGSIGPIRGRCLNQLRRNDRLAQLAE